MTSCAMCGDCCRLIHLNPAGARTRPGEEPSFLPRDTAYMLWLRDDDHRDPAVDSDMDFIITNWEEQTVEQARAISPAFVDLYAPLGNLATFYTCKQFDAERNLCKVHDAQPRVCSGFPWYEAGPNEKSVLQRTFLRCSFWADIPRERWPEGCDPLLSPPEGLIQVQPLRRSKG